ncbi:superinfection immunity protein [uncultured Sphingomonas sp.]|uniref:superinfection immunity protein n=1 Tax=uncultured Sphingomonas sp. TaxID=158754 RepID=UPI0035CB417B
MHNPTLVAVAVVAALGFFATPALIAFARRHPERRTILRLSVFALFSFVLWAALLTWAVSDKRDDGVIARYVARLRQTKLLPLIVGGLVVVGAVGSAVTLLR